MSLWNREFRKYILESFTDPIILFGNFIFYTTVGLLLAFSYDSDTADKKGVEDFFKLFKYASFAQSAYGMVTNSVRLNEPRIYIIGLSDRKTVGASDTIRNLNLITLTSVLFRICITFWYSLMIYPIVSSCLQHSFFNPFLSLDCVEVLKDFSCSG